MRGMRHELTLQLRFCDTDALGHINNAAYAQYAELGRLALMREADTLVANLILARLEIDFRQQLTPDQEAVITTGVESFGNTSLRLRQSVIVNGKSACDIQSVLVFFDYETNRPTRVSDEVRAKLGKYMEPANKA